MEIMSCNLFRFGIGSVVAASLILAGLPNWCVGSLIFRRNTGHLTADVPYQKVHPSLTPPMGFNTWNAFACRLSELNEANIRRTVRLMNETGLVEAGYDTFVIDDCWAVKDHRDPETGRIMPDPDRFPSGMAALGEFIKSMGMKFGMYGDMGTHTCERYPGSLGHEDVDAKMFAEWGVDYLKVDGCFNTWDHMREGYTTMSKALESTGRPVMYSCSWPAYALSGPLTPEDFDWDYLGTICDTWRLHGDIIPSWPVFEDIMDYWATWQHALAPATRKGAWNDPDFLQAGHPSISLDEAKTQMAVWSIIAAPLILSVNILTGFDPHDGVNPWLSKDVIDILTNREIIQMNQEQPPRQGLRISHTKEQDIWARPMNDGSLSLVMVNRSDAPQTMVISWKRLVEMLLPVGITIPVPKTYAVRDMWLHKDLGNFPRKFTSSRVPPHGCLALKLSPVDKSVKSTAVFK